MKVIDLQKEELTEKERRHIEILQILRRHGPLSRSDIAKDMAINVVTISSYIDDFIKNNLVYEKELDVSEGGRRPVLLDLNPQGGYVIGVGLNLMNMVGLLVDLKGNIILKTQFSRPDASANETVECLLEIIREMIRRSKDYTNDIRGIGAGIAGIIDKNNGSIRWPERRSYNYTNYVSINLPLKELIEKEFGLPVLIENDATAACFGEQCFQLEPSLKNVVYMFSGVGSGIMINGSIYTGSCGCAGELFLYNYKKDQPFNNSLGNPCFLKQWDADLGIIEDMKSMLANDKDKAIKFFRLTASNIENVDLKSVFIAARANDELANLALQRAASKLGIQVASLVNLLNPDAVIIGGGFEEAGEDFLNKVSSTVRDWAFREATENLKIVYSQLRENAVAFGAASLVMQRTFAQL